MCFICDYNASCNLESSKPRCEPTLTVGDWSLENRTKAATSNPTATSKPLLQQPVTSSDKSILVTDSGRYLTMGSLAASYIVIYRYRVLEATRSYNEQYH